MEGFYAVVVVLLAVYCTSIYNSKRIPKGLARVDKKGPFAYLQLVGTSALCAQDKDRSYVFPLKGSTEFF